MLLINNDIKLIYEREEIEYLSVPFDMMIHGVTPDLTLVNFSGEVSLFVEEDYLTF